MNGTRDRRWLWAFMATVLLALLARPIRTLWRGHANDAKCIQDLMDALDTFVAEPARPLDQPFLMPIEDVFSIEGRGTVVTGRVERGMIKVGEEVEIVGLRDTKKTTVTGVEMFRKLLDQGQASTDSSKSTSQSTRSAKRVAPKASNRASNSFPI